MSNSSCDARAVNTHHVVAGSSHCPQGGRSVWAAGVCDRRLQSKAVPATLPGGKLAPITQAARLPCVLLTCCSKPPSDFSLQAERYCLSLVALCRKLGSILGDTGTLSNSHVSLATEAVLHLVQSERCCALQDSAAVQMIYTSLNTSVGPRGSEAVLKAVSRAGTELC